jgi:hypothetical protein
VSEGRRRKTGGRARVRLAGDGEAAGRRGGKGGGRLFAAATGRASARRGLAAGSQPAGSPRQLGVPAGPGGSVWGLDLGTGGSSCPVGVPAAAASGGRAPPTSGPAAGRWTTGAPRRGTRPAAGRAASHGFDHRSLLRACCPEGGRAGVGGEPLFYRSRTRFYIYLSSGYGRELQRHPAGGAHLTRKAAAPAGTGPESKVSGRRVLATGPRPHQRTVGGVRER